MTQNKFVIIIISLLIVLYSPISLANKKSNTTHAGPVQATLVVDGKTGKILQASNANTRIYPASLTKVMTLYLLFEALDSGKIDMNHKFTVSKYASEARPLKLFLKPGEKIDTKTAIQAITIKSANDVSRAVAEGLAGSETNFAKIMTKRAKQLGMKHTNFTNASGWHDPKQVSTAIDLAKLSIAIERDFPQYFHFFKQTSFTYKGKTILGHNKVTENYPGATGLKTGYHIPAGCNLITTVTRNGKSLVAVITGGKSAASRNQKMVALLDSHFGVKHTPIIQTAAKKQGKIVKHSKLAKLDKKTKLSKPPTSTKLAKASSNSKKKIRKVANKTSNKKKIS